MPRRVDFVTGVSPKHPKKKPERLALCTAYPKLDNIDSTPVIHHDHVNPRHLSDTQDMLEDGLYMPSEGPLTSCVIKPYQLDYKQTIVMQRSPQHSKKLLEIVIQDVKIHGNSSDIITSIQILYKHSIICKISRPFNQKLYKLLINNVAESSDTLSIQIRTKSDCSNLPLPLPGRCVKDKKLEIEFSITSNHVMHSGTFICMISLSMRENLSTQEPLTPIIRSTNDPNDPQNSLSFVKTRKKLSSKKSVDYFELVDSALTIPSLELSEGIAKPHQSRLAPPKLVVVEQPRLSLWDLSLGNFFEARRPLRPSTEPQKHRAPLRDGILNITVLRGVEMPVRTESSTVQPVIQVQWGDQIQFTSVADSSTPVWQQTIHFGMPSDIASSVKLSLYDQHPLWGLQWLGEASISLDFPDNYTEIERWVGLSALTSPVTRFGYVASPAGSHTRIYVLVKMDRLVDMDAGEKRSLDVLSRAIQRCLVQPYKISGTETADRAAKVAMLLASLPVNYGPLSARQALKLNKVDYYGRTALLASLLQGLGLEASVVLGSSQARRWVALVMTVDTETKKIELWDPENGDRYRLGESRCSLTRVFRVINYQNVWKNLQKAALITNVKFNVKNGKEWQPLGNPVTVAREVQLLDIPQDDVDENISLEIENTLKDKLSTWRTQMGFTTVFNRHAMHILKEALINMSSNFSDDGSVDKSDDFRQLYRAYNVHGFVINLRYGALNELVDFFASTKVQDVTGPIEFAVVCQIQRYVGKIMSLWMGIIVLRNKE